MVCFCFRSNKVSPTKGIELPDIIAVPEASSTQGAGAASQPSTVPETAVSANHSACPEDANAAAEDSDVSVIPAIPDASAVSGPPVIDEDFAISDPPRSLEDCAVGEKCGTCEESVNLGGEVAITEDGCTISKESANCGDCSQADDLGTQCAVVESCVGEETTGEVEKSLASFGVSAAQNSTADKSADDVQSQVPQDPHQSPNSSVHGNVTKRTIGRFDVYSSSDVTETDDVTAVSSRRPLVILIPWLNAKKRHVSKYSRLYVENGMDVLLMQLTPMQVLRPLRVKSIARELLDLLQEKEGFLADRPLLVHGFSVGAFVWGQILVEMNVDPNCGEQNAEDVFRGCEISLTSVDISDDDAEDCSSADDTTAVSGSGEGASKDQTDPETKPKKGANSLQCSNNSYSAVHQRIVGVVMDSPAPVEAMLKGIPSSLSKNTLIQMGLRHLLASYLRLFPRSVTRHYQEGEQAVEANVARHPVLMLYSSADLIVSSTKLDSVADEWQRRGVLVQVCKWEDSPHVDHFRPHKEQYVEELRVFLEKIWVRKAEV